MFVPQSGQKGAISGLEMRGDHADFLSGRFDPQQGQQGDLITLHPPNFQDLPIGLEEVELVSPKEDGAAVWTVVTIDVVTGRVRLREEHSGVTLGVEDVLEEVEVVDLLQADDVGAVFKDLFDHEVAPVVPFEGCEGAAGEVVVPLAQG